AHSYFQEDEILGKAYDARLVRRLWQYILPHRRIFYFTLLLVLFSTGADLLAPFVTQVAIDHYILPIAGIRLDATARINGAFLMSLLYLLLLCAGFGLRYYENYLLSVVGQRVMYDLRAHMFDHLQQLSLSFFDRNPVGRLMTRITNDVDSLNDLFTSGSVSLVGDILTLGTIVVILFIESWQLALIVCVVIPPLIFVTMVFQRFMRENF